MMSGSGLQKGLLKFEFELPTSSLAQAGLSYCIGKAHAASSGPNLGASPSANVEDGGVSESFLFSAFYEGSEIARCLYTIRNKVLIPSLYFKSDFAEDAFIAVSVVKIFLLEAEQNGLAESLKVLSLGNLAFEAELVKFGFSRIGDEIYLKSLDTHKGALVAQTKASVLEKIKSAPKIGRGYAMSTSELDPTGLQLLSQEYNEIAWGLTSWAKHATIDEDEAQVIERFASGKAIVEIGAGSGRVSELLASRASKATLTDYTKESCEVLKSKFRMQPDVQILQDDVTSTKLDRSHYDVVFFLENGLGNILSESSRKLAVEQMCSLIKDDGRVVLGLRSLEVSPCEHVMIATQNEHILGIYHTFSKDELQEMLPEGFFVEEMIQGNPRPAGGSAFFVSIARRP